MNEEYMNLASLPGRQGEQTWLWNRLERLSVWEGKALAALTQHRPPNTAEEMVNHVLALQSCAVYLAPGGYEDLGKREVCRMAGKDPDELLPHVDLHALGMRFEDLHPGLFVENCFVAYPSEKTPIYRGRDSPLPEDEDWSVKLKLASASAPEGVWLRLPDYQGLDADCASDGETALAKDALRVQSLDECTLLEISRNSTTALRNWSAMAMISASSWMKRARALPIGWPGSPPPWNMRAAASSASRWIFLRTLTAMSGCPAIS